MLILLPPSESKAKPAARGRPVDLDTLSFPSLAALRSRVLDALVATSRRPDAIARLTVPASVADEVAANVLVRELPARSALEVYTGVLYDALDAATLSPAARRRARSRVVVVSALWGALRPTDRIPPYRMPACADLVDVGPLEPAWREVLGPVLADAAGVRGLVLDCRSSSYQALGTPRELTDRTVVVRVVRDVTDVRAVGGHVAKRVRGELVRHLLESGADPGMPERLPDALSDRWAVAITGPRGPRRPWVLSVAEPG